MLHTISFLKVVKEDISHRDASKLVDYLQSYYSCPSDWHLALQAVPVNNTVGFLCNTESNDININDLSAFVQEQLEKTPPYTLDAISGNINVVFELCQN